MTRRFYESDLLERLVDYVESREEMENVEEASIFLSFPRRDILRSDTITLRDFGLQSNDLICVRRKQ